MTELSKTCTTCKVTKPLPLGFHRDVTKKSGYSSQCKVCKEARKRVTRNTPEGARKAREKSARHAAKVRAEKSALVRKAKESSTCTDCGRYGPYYCMDFDHVGEEKNFDISQGVNNRMVSLKALKRELELCELVCAYCHRIRTHERGYRRRSNN